MASEKIAIAAGIEVTLPASINARPVEAGMPGSIRLHKGDGGIPVRIGRYDRNDHRKAVTPALTYQKAKDVEPRFVA